ncbi:MAG TPA: NMD3-related protein [Candidatus Nanoarchaeia archaeon]|nr:NMD3-related protein [Candidatus Nanoarchaeia archaeon]
MDFCVKCGKKELYEDFLCEKCYTAEHPQRTKKTKERKKPETQHSGYFEATLQIRVIDQHIVDFAYKDIEKHGIIATKEKWLPNGVDVSVSSRKYAQQLGKTLQQKFGGLLKMTARIFTRDRQSSKDVYRITVLFKQFPYKKGDTFTYKGTTYVVKNASREVIGEDETHKEKIFRYNELERAHVF